jgi:ribose 1,5-bisphosphokinase PhnN
MTKDLSGGINRPKKMYKPAAKGDNPMAVESIKDRLYRALSEKKAKPDFLDMDKDGNKKEPMKKAIADKKVKEAAKPDFLDMDNDGNKKEPMKKAIADKKKHPFKK